MAFWVSLRLASWTTATLLVLGLPLAWFLARTRFPGKALLEAVIALPLVLPPTVLGFYLLLALGPNSFLGQQVVRLTGEALPFTFRGIVIGSVLFNLPFAVRPFTAAFQVIDRRFLEASWCLGVSRWATFRRVVIPLAGPGILAGLVLTFAHALGEFGVVLMLGGNIPGITRTLSVAVYDQVQALDYPAAQETSLVLVAFCLIGIVTVSYLQRHLISL
jgi:molybdate transport system permease protein